MNRHKFRVTVPLQKKNNLAQLSMQLLETLPVFC